MRFVGILSTESKQYLKMKCKEKDLKFFGHKILKNVTFICIRPPESINYQVNLVMDFKTKLQNRTKTTLTTSTRFYLKIILYLALTIFLSTLIRFVFSYLIRSSSQCLHCLLHCKTFESHLVVSTIFDTLSQINWLKILDFEPQFVTL